MVGTVSEPDGKRGNGVVTGWEIAEPRADALIESLRAFGYSPEAAIADLIDNSISANAKTIDVDFHWEGRASRVTVTDDGAGMDEEHLVTAMRPGSTSPLETRGPRDLGRFGLGLKTASFSQARELTVMTRRRADSETLVRRWDLDVVASTGEWRLLKSAPPSLGRPELDGGARTRVVWTKCDRLVGDVDVSDSRAQARFNSVARAVAEHLSAVFHRFTSGRGRVTIRVNGNTVTPWDPFMTGHPATQSLGAEVLTLGDEQVRVTPYVLPHRSKLDEAEQTAGEGVRGWNHQQGFYLYRGDRLLVQGDWLGVGGAKDEHTKLARIAIDIPTSLDHAWQVDVRKASARAPEHWSPTCSASPGWRDDAPRRSTDTVDGSSRGAPQKSSSWHGSSTRTAREKPGTGSTAATRSSPP